MYSLEYTLKHIFHKYAKNLCLYARNYLPVEADAEDIVQDVFVRCWEKKQLILADEKAVKAYLFNAVKNACLDKLEKKRPVYAPLDLLKQEIIEEETFLFDEKIIEGNQGRIGANAPANPQNHFPYLYSKYEIPRGRRRNEYFHQYSKNPVAQWYKTFT